MHDDTVMDAPEILARYRDADGTVPPHVCLTLLARYATGQPDEGEARVTALEALAAAHHLATAARAVYGPLVAAAQAEGASWADIGAALGISRQAAHTTYRHAKKEPSSMLSLFRRPAPPPPPGPGRAPRGPGRDPHGRSAAPPPRSRSATCSRPSPEPLTPRPRPWPT